MVVGTVVNRQLTRSSAVAEREREKVYFPQYNKIYVGLNDNNKTKWRVAG